MLWAVAFLRCVRAHSFEGQRTHDPGKDREVSLKCADASCNYRVNEERLLVCAGAPGENPKNLFDFTRRSHPRAPDGVLQQYLPSEQAYLTGLDAGQKNDPSITQERNPFEELVHEQVSFGPGSAQRWS